LLSPDAKCVTPRNSFVNAKRNLRGMLQFVKNEKKGMRQAAALSFFIPLHICTSGIIRKKSQDLKRNKAGIMRK
jgi:hypothetical protein